MRLMVQAAGLPHIFIVAQVVAGVGGVGGGFKKLMFHNDALQAQLLVCSRGEWTIIWRIREKHLRRLLVLKGRGAGRVGSGWGGGAGG